MYLSLNGSVLIRLPGPLSGFIPYAQPVKALYSMTGLPYLPHLPPPHQHQLCPKRRRRHRRIRAVDIHASSRPLLYFTLYRTAVFVMFPAASLALTLNTLLVTFRLVSIAAPVTIGPVQLAISDRASWQSYCATTLLPIA